MFLTYFNKALEDWNLLNHTFYQQWNEGTLKHETLQLYAKEYYHHVAAFPRYISQIHSLCTNQKSRQILLDNLIDEEKGDENHPELWLRFAEGLKVSRSSISSFPQLSSTKKLVDGFFNLVKTDFATGLGALYAYERQTPVVSTSKISGLKTHYNIHEEKYLQFFSVHEKTDEWHTEELTNLIENLNKSDQEKTFQGGLQGAKLLWGFLDGINTSYAN